MATPFDRLMTTIRPYAPGAIDEAIKQELYMACIDFLKWSTAWREDIEYTVPANSKEADLVPYAGRIDRLLYVMKDGLGINGVTMPQPGCIRMRHAHGADEDYIATVALTVSDPMTRDAFPIIPYDLVTRYTEELMHGTLARLLSQPSKPYTNLSMAQFYMNKAKGGASRARLDINNQNTAGSQKWTFPRNFANV